MTFEFETENRTATFVKITTRIGKDEWPLYQRNNSADAKFTLNLRNHRIHFVAMEVRGLEAILSLFGVTSIDTEDWEIQYIPENDDESKSLPITKFSQRTEKIAPAIDIPLGHEILSNAVAASVHAELSNLSFPLSFFRKGRISMLEGRFIRAYYDFYFVLETLYGNGKYNNAAVKAEFKNSPILRAAAKDALDFAEKNYSSQETRKAFVERFQNLTEDSLLEYMVDKRGFLHHHTARRRGIWHPAQEEDWEIDAILIQGIALNVLGQELEKLYATGPVQADCIQARDQR